VSSPFYSTELVRRLGMKDARLPIIGKDAQPVILLGDFSQGVVNDPLEARAFCGSAIGAFTAIELFAAAPLVIEQLSALGGSPIRIDVLATSTIGPPGPVANVPILQCGGVPAVSKVRTGGSVALSGTAQTWGSTGLAPALRIFVPSGSAFVIQAPGAVAFSLLWRELSQAGPQ